MKIKWFLILAPTILSLALLQSYFWVPTYESQTKGNPDRVFKFIEASIGDAKILNPALNADSASSRIAGLVFEGLLDYDENLNLRARLATDWTITETAYLIVNPDAYFPDGTRVTANEMEIRLKQSIKNELKQNVTNIKLLPAEPEELRTKVILMPEKVTVKVEMKVKIPERIKFSLRRVDQNFFDKLAPIIGANYEVPPDKWILDINYYKKPTPSEDKWVAFSPPQPEKLRPKLAEIMPIVFEHNPIILFNLRKGVRFHDGHELNAGDVKFTYEAIMNSKNISPRTSDFEPIKSVEIVDPYTVRVTYKRLFSPAINAWMMGILPEHLLNDAALQREMDQRGLSETARKSFGMRDSQFNRQPIGAGPFRFVQWQSDELIHLTRNDDYWEGAPQYKEYYYRIIPDAITQEIEFRTGAIDTYSPQPHQAARYKKDDTYQWFSSLGFGYTYIGYNNRKKPFSDKRVRRALGMAINVDEINKYILYGEAERITGPYPKNTPWYDHNIKPIPYDPKGALHILEQLGWQKNADGWLEKDGKIFEFNLITNNGNLQRKAIMTIAQNSWRKIGIKCNTQLFEWAVFLEDFVNPAKFDALILGWSMGVDPDLYQLWHSSQSGYAQLNFVGYNNPEADQLIVQIRREYDFATQQKMTHKLHQLIADEQPYTFLYAPLSHSALDKKIVMVEADGSYSKLKPTKTGNIFFYFNRWRKLEFTPTF